MDKDTAEDTTFLAGFNEFWDSEFPKACSKCGRLYGDFSDFARNTLPAQGDSGLMEFLDDDRKASVGIFRNCTCGSTLMIRGSNRRDTTEVGENRRRIFDLMLNRLVNANVPREHARKRLFRILHSGQLNDLSKRLLG